MNRLLRVLLFALAVGATFAASTGVAPPPHRVPEGTPVNHTLVLGAYRFVFLIEPATVDGVLAPEMAALHKAFALAGLPMTEMPGMAPSSTSDLPLFATGGLHPTHDLAITLALLMALAPRLPRPTRRVIAVLALTDVPAQQWRPALPLGPPRPFVVPLLCA